MVARSAILLAQAAAAAAAAAAASGTGGRIVPWGSAADERVRSLTVG